MRPCEAKNSGLRLRTSHYFSSGGRGEGEGEIEGFSRGSHGFRRERTGNQSSPTEYKGETSDHNDYIAEPPQTPTPPPPPPPPPVPKSNLFLPTVSPLNKEKNHKLKKFLIVRQILLAVALEYVWRTVWRICILMLGRYELTREKKQQTDSLTKVVLTFLLRRAMTGEFSLDLHCLSAGGGERLCDEICVSKFHLLMSGSLSIRLSHKVKTTTDVT